jgi:flagellar hook assembly protein FlgD
MRDQATVHFDLASEGEVELAIFDVTGRRVRRLMSEWAATGNHLVTWDGRDERGEPLATGVYFARMRSEGQDKAVRLILLR